MDSGDLVLIFIAAVASLVAACLGAVDAALTRISHVNVERFVRAGRPGAASLARVVADPGRHLALLLLLRIVGEMAAAACITVVFVHAYGAGFAAVGLGTLVATLVAYILVGVMFRTLGRQHAPAVALAAAGLTLRLTKIFGPLPRLLIALGNAVTPGPGYRDGPFATEAELRDLVDLAEENEVIEPEERDMIASVFELGDTLVREVMVPRPDMVFIESTKTVRQAISLALRGGFSRIPVIGESVDDVVGIVFLKDLVGREREGWGDRPVSEVMRPPALVPESKPADDLLREMQASRTHMAIVIDEYGGTAGLVTIEDILEEIVGEITDEYDTGAPPVEWLDDTTARVTARLDVEDLAEMFDVHDLPGADDVETVGGLLANALGRVPIPGATVEVGGLRLVAERAAGRRNRIGTIVVQRLPTPPGGEQEPAGAGGGRQQAAGRSAGRNNHGRHGGRPGNGRPGSRPGNGRSGSSRPGDGRPGADEGGERDAGASEPAAAADSTAAALGEAESGADHEHPAGRNGLPATAPTPPSGEPAAVSAPESGPAPTGRGPSESP